MIREYEAVSVEEALDAKGEESDGMERKVENHIGYSVRVELDSGDSLRKR